MKKVFLVLLMACNGFILLAQNSAKQDPFLTKSLSGEMIKQIEAQTSGGNISAESVAIEQARVEVYIKPSNSNGGNAISKEEIQNRLDEYYEMKIEVASNTLTLIAKNKRQNMNWKNSLSISFKIFVNSNVSTHLTTSGGNISLTALTGEQKITTSGGNLSIDNVKGKLKGATSGGNIQVKNCSDKIDLSTSGGNIDANNCTGEIKLTTSGGSVNLVNLDGNIDASTSGGNVQAKDIKGELKAYTSGGNINMSGLSCNLNTGTSGGNVFVAIKEPGKFIKIKNSGGKIDLQLPAGKGYDLDLSADKIKTDNLTNFSGKSSDDELNGTVNGGGTEVTANASSGKITLTFK